MLVRIDNEKFKVAHEAFKEHMQQQDEGTPFTNFGHPFLIKDEIAYKWGVYDKASRLLNLNRWRSWQKKPGNIIRATKKACKASSNLLEHRYGSNGYSESALYRVTSIQQIKELENHLFGFFLGGTSNQTEFASRFDTFAEYLRENRLGCKWDFVTYLAFLLQPQIYFPIRSTRFDHLLAFYGIDERISGLVSWDRYRLLLDLAELLKTKLALYGQANAVEIQSYMWVVSYLIGDGKVIKKEYPTTPDFDSELIKRMHRSQEQERIGLIGEQFVYEQERNKLLRMGYNELADCVSVVSLDDGGSSGFDVLSFNSDGSELHIEVKTTVRQPEDDTGFWLSEGEREQAHKDLCWTIYRVWGADSSLRYKNIGNIVKNEDANWELKASSWYVQRK